MTITPGNVNDRKPLSQKSFINKLWGKLFGQGVQLITKFKRNMKSSVLTL